MSARRFAELTRLFCRPNSVRAAVLGHLIVVIVAFAAFAGGVALHERRRAAPAEGAEHPLPARMAHYERHRQSFDLVFLGDSRTYCGIHPEVIDPLLGTRSVNLSSFAHWLPTQYPQARRIAGTVPRGAVVVWSLGHQNFFPSASIRRIYPIGVADGISYLRWDVPGDGLWDNVFYFTPGLQPFALRANWHARLFNWMDRPARALRLVAPANAASPSLPREPSAEVDPPGIEQAGAAILEKLRADPRVSSALAVRDEGRVNSVVAHLKGGGYYRVELDPGYFRRKQRAMNYPPADEATARAAVLPAPHPGYWRLFEETLVEFERAGVRLVVNEVEEAPFTYRHPVLRAKWRAFMRERVQPAVEEHGFSYTRVDFDRFEDADYFDYNHLNSRGIHKYAPALAERLAPVIAKGGR